MDEPADEFDGPWKEALDGYLRPFAELLFPRVADDIDWAAGVEPLDTELQKLVPEAEAGRGSVDKLVRVRTRSGLPRDVLVHVEVQSQKDADFARRMYRYNHRVEDRYGRMPVSLAVLADDDRWWRPEEHNAGLWRCGVKFHFPVAKVVDYRGREAELEASPNPFAAFVLAHLKAAETKGDPAARLGWKLRVVKGLYDRGWGGPEVRKLFRLVDRVLALPAPQAAAFRADLEAFEKEKQVPYVTSIERMALAEGRAEGLYPGIELGLKLRFGLAGVALMPLVREVKDPAALESFLKAVETASDLAALAALLPPAGG